MKTTQMFLKDLVIFINFLGPNIKMFENNIFMKFIKNLKYF